MSRTWKRVIVGLVALVILNVALGAVLASDDRADKVSLSAMLDAIDAGQVDRATIRTGRVSVELRGGRKVRTSFPDTYNDDLIAMLHQRRAYIEVESTPSWIILAAVLVPLGLFAAFWVWLGRRLPPRPRPDVPDVPEQAASSN